jgi:hypothetical protein
MDLFEDADLSQISVRFLWKFLHYIGNPHPITSLHFGENLHTKRILKILLMF